MIKRALVLALLLLVSASPTLAQKKPSVASRVGHFLKKNWEPIAAGGIIVGAWGADAGSSIYCQNTLGRGCVERNPILGKHPSAGATIGYAAGVAGLQIGLNALIWHFAPDTTTKQIIWLPTLAMGVAEFFNVRDNVNGTEYYQNLHKATAARLTPIKK